MAEFYYESRETTAIFPQNTGNCRYLTSKRQYPPLFCYQLPSTFFSFVRLCAFIGQKFGPWRDFLPRNEFTKYIQSLHEAYQ